MNRLTDKPCVAGRSFTNQRPTFAGDSTETLSSRRKYSIKNQLGRSLETGEAVSFLGKHRENHTHIIGGTGTGKSKLLELMLRQDIKNRNSGLCLIDPHGSLYEEILLYASHSYPRLAERIILFNPAQELQNVAGFNPVPDARIHLDYILDMLISACLKAWGQDNTDRTPRISKWLENIFYPLIVNNLTLVESVPFISISKESKEQRDVLLSSVNNPTVRDDWMMFDSSTNTQKQNLIEGASNRLRKFLRNEIIRNIIGQQEHTLDFARIMDQGKIILINLNGGDRISHENAQLLGIMLVNEIFRVAKLRDARNPDLKPFYFYIDEFGQFITRDIARALEETRKFKVFMVLAHQHLAQLKKEDEYLYSSVMTNCKNKVVFGSLSKEDADIMTDEVWTGFHELLSVKSELATTKVRHHEETRAVHGKNNSTSQTYSRGDSQSRTEGQSKSFTEGTTQSYSASLGTAKTTGSSVTDTRGTSETNSINESRGESIMRGSSQGYADTTGASDSRVITSSFQETRGTSYGQSNGISQGESFTENSSRTSGSSDSHSLSESQSQNRMRGYSGITGSNATQGESHGNTTSRQESEGIARGQTESYTQGETRTQSSSRSEGHSNSRSHTDSSSFTDNFSQSDARTESYAQGKSHALGKNESRAISEQTSQTKSQSSSQTHGTTRSEGRGENESKTCGVTETHGKSESQGESEQIVPFLRPEEYKEVSSRTYWSKDELHYQKMAEMKNQDTGKAVIRIGAEPPIETEINHVKSVFYNPRTSPKRIDDFREKVFRANQEYYLPLQKARLACQERQIAVFGEPLSFEESLPDDDEIIEIKAVMEKTNFKKLENPFE